MARFYPRKQTVGILVVCLIAVGGTYAYANWDKLAHPEKASYVAPANNPPESLGALPETDWQKQFFGSTTGAFVSSNKKPAVAAVNESLTLTDQLSRDFFSRYLELNSAKLADNDQLVADVVSRSLDNAVTAAKQPSLYALKDIIVIPDSGQAALRAYGNAVGKVFYEFAPRENLMTIADAAFEKNDMALLKNIGPIATRYKNTVTKLLQVPAPAAIAAYHLDLVNGMNSMTNISTQLSNTSADPMQALVSLSEYPTTQTVIENALAGMKAYFKNADLAFTDKEPGLIFAIVSQ